MDPPQRVVSENFFRALKFSDITPYVLRLQVLLPHKIHRFLIVFEKVVYLTKGATPYTVIGPPPGGTCHDRILAQNFFLGHFLHPRTPQNTFKTFWNVSGTSADI